VRSNRDLPAGTEKEPAMMFAFAVAIVGAIVLGSLEVASHVHAHN